MSKFYFECVILETIISCMKYNKLGKYRGFNIKFSLIFNVTTRDLCGIEHLEPVKLPELYSRL